MIPIFSPSKMKKLRPMLETKLFPRFHCTKRISSFTHNTCNVCKTYPATFKSTFTGSAPGRTSQLLRLGTLSADDVPSLTASRSATLPVLCLYSHLAHYTVHTPILCKNWDFVKKQFLDVLHNFIKTYFCQFRNFLKILF